MPDLIKHSMDCGAGACLKHFVCQDTDAVLQVIIIIAGCQRRSFLTDFLIIENLASRFNESV